MSEAQNKTMKSFGEEMTPGKLALEVIEMRRSLDRLRMEVRDLRVKLEDLQSTVSHLDNRTIRMPKIGGR
jgi:hypothetical protein